MDRQRQGRMRGREKTEKERETRTEDREKESEIVEGQTRRPTGRETEDKRAEDDSERGGSGAHGDAEGLVAESPLCSRAALRGFLRGRGKVVGEYAQLPCGP